MKDPAFLFYSNDFSVGTQFFTDEQVGQYMRLLLAQHQHGHLTEKQVIFICKSYDFDIMLKFKKDAEGNFYNERLEQEILKRKKYSESRGNNKKGKNKQTDNVFKGKIISKSYDNHMENENKNENSINNKGVIQKKSKKTIAFVPPLLSDVQNYFIEKGFSKELANRAFEFYNIANWQDSHGNQVKNWKQKMLAVWLKPENKEKNIIDGKQLSYNKTGKWDAETTALDAMAKLQYRRENAL